MGNLASRPFPRCAKGPARANKLIKFGSPVRSRSHSRQSPVVKQAQFTLSARLGSLAIAQLELCQQGEKKKKNKTAMYMQKVMIFAPPANSGPTDLHPN